MADDKLTLAELDPVQSKPEITNGSKSESSIKLAKILLILLFGAVIVFISSYFFFYPSSPVELDTVDEYELLDADFRELLNKYDILFNTTKQYADDASGLFDLIQPFSSAILRLKQACDSLLNDVQVNSHNIQEILDLLTAQMDILDDLAEVSIIRELDALTQLGGTFIQTEE
ncbi:hypothetical protein ADUPG1_013762, partial [Aduncisulcus paluster]